MSTPPAVPYDWLKFVEPHLVDRRQLAVIEVPEAFSWEALGRILAQHFEVPSLHLHAGTPTWRAENTAEEEIAAPVTRLRYAVGNFPGEVQWILSLETATELMADLLTGQSGQLAISDPGFLEGFLRYVAAEILQLLSSLGFHQSLAPRFLEGEAKALQGKILGIDLQIALGQRSYPTRLLISESLAQAWKKHFMKLGRRQELSPSLANQTEVTAHLESGHVTLSQQQWAALAEGDFLLLDSSLVTPGLEKGRVMLTVGGVPLFRCMLKAGQIKILEHPLYHEVDTPMNGTEDDENSAFEDEETSEEEEGDEEVLNAEVEEAVAPETVAPQEVTQEAGEMEELPEERELTPAEKIPLTIIIEVGRLKMTLSKLRDLQPGQLLEIDVKPEDGVNLVINGACVGRGELLRIGETLGVRILELG